MQWPPPLHAIENRDRSIGMGILFDVGPSEARRTVSEYSRSLRVTGLSLVDPARSAGDQREVTVWAEVVGHDAAFLIGRLSSEAPIAAVRPVVFACEFLLWHDSPAGTVRFYGDVIDAASLGDDDEEEGAVSDDEEEGEAVLGEDEEQVAVLGEDDEEVGAAWVEFEPPDEDAAAEMYDSDNGEDEGDGEEAEPPSKVTDGESSGESSKSAGLKLVAAPTGSVMPEGQFLGPARFATVENTAGFMRVTTAEDAAGGQESKDIVVLYRYTRFSRTWSGRRGVEACRRTKLHCLRFVAPPGGDMESSLAWAGSALGPLIYPALFRRPLHELWSSLAAPAISSVPSRATRLQITMDVGILRREDHTPERMEFMRGELEAMAREAWPGYYHVVKDLHLPEPVHLEKGEDGSMRPTKRIKIAMAEKVEEDCSVCFEALESGLAAWPGCGHVFHGTCVEQMLTVNEMCPLCRHKLSDTFTNSSDI
ncbi:hypothetical protein ACP70R_003422 [Stipagrostis hirtigluma subsp. patula]